MHHKGMISIWFFIGVLVLIYGVLIAGAGAYEFVSPPERPLVLSDLHAALYWGLLLIAIGAFYTWRFRPSRTR